MTVVLLGSAQRYLCLSSDTKPTSGVNTGAACYETDTGAAYVYNGSTWTLQHQAAVLTATIADEGTESTVVDLGGAKLAAIHMSAGWDAADLTIHAAPTLGGTYYAVYDDLGVALLIKAAAARTIGLDSVAGMIAGLRFIKLVASAAQTTAARTLYLIVKE